MSATPRESEFWIDDEQVSALEFHKAQLLNEVLYGNTYEHVATLADGRRVRRAISPSRVFHEGKRVSIKEDRG